MPGQDILRVVNNKREKHMTWRRCVNGYNLTQTILLIGKVTTVVQVVTSAVTADTLPITQTLELFRKTLSTTMWFTYIQTWSNILHPDYMKTQHSPNIKNNKGMPKKHHFNVFNCLAFISYSYTNSYLTWVTDYLITQPESNKILHRSDFIFRK